MISLSDRMIENYLSLSDEELEEIAVGRARLRDASFSIDERPSGTCLAAFTVPSRIEDDDITLLSAEGMIAAAHFAPCCGWTIRRPRASATRSNSSA
jgi:hypothetical protein